jgi:hypothetical protein
MPNIKIRVNKSQPHFDLKQMRRDQYMQFKVQETVKNTCRRLAKQANVNPFTDNYGNQPKVTISFDLTISPFQKCMQKFIGQITI